jgi:hypothetical protein
MNQLLIFITMIILAIGIIEKKPTKSEDVKPTQSPEVLSESVSPTPSATPMETISPTEPPNYVSEPNLIPTPTFAPDNNWISQFKYPNASSSSGGNELITEYSNDMPDIVRKWYQDKVNGNGFNSVHWNIKNNNNNGEALFNATLEAEKNGNKIKVTIIKNPKDSQTKIVITAS